jgi:hypothetical protein
MRPLQTAAEATQMFGHGNEAFRGRTCLSTGVLVCRLDIGALSHKDLVDVVEVEREVLRTAKAQIGNGCARIGLHALSEACKGWPVEGCLGGVTKEVFGGDQKALAVEGHLKGGAKFGARMRLPALDGAGIEVIERDQTVCNVALTSQLLPRLRLKYGEHAQELEGVFTLSLRHRQERRIGSEGIQGGYKAGMELAQIGLPLRRLAQIESPPPGLQLLRVPPQGQVLLLGKRPKFAKGLVEQADVVGLRDRAFQDT